MVPGARCAPRTGSAGGAVAGVAECWWTGNGGRRSWKPFRGADDVFPKEVTFILSLTGWKRAGLAT